MSFNYKVPGGSPFVARIIIQRQNLFSTIVKKSVEEKRV